MSRVQTSYYGAEATTRFQWATTDNDLFDREFDLYFLSQALERHDHSAGRGLAVTRLADLTITQSMYGLLSIPTSALQDLSVTTSKIAAGAVTDDRMANQKANINGAIFVSDIRISRTSDPPIGLLYFGNAGHYMGALASNALYINNGVGGPIVMMGDPYTRRPGDPNTGYLFFGPGEHIGWNGSTFIMRGYRMHSEQFDASFPMGGTCWFRTNAQLVAAGAKFARETTADGRFLVGVGSTAGQTFAENTQYGANWTPSVGLGVNAGSLAVSGGGGGSVSLTPDGAHIFLAASASSNNSSGATNVQTSENLPGVSGGGGSPASLSGSPALTGTGTPYFPPVMVAVWGVRVA